jgi:hypothetical protein
MFTVIFIFIFCFYVDLLQSVGSYGLINVSASSHFSTFEPWLNCSARRIAVMDIYLAYGKIEHLNRAEVTYNTVPTATIE